MKSTSNRWNQLIFENRNKKYGAYEIRTGYYTRVVKSFISTMLLLGLLSLFFILSIKKTKTLMTVPPVKEMVELKNFLVDQPILIYESKPQENSIAKADPLAFKPVAMIDKTEKQTDISKIISTSLSNTISNSTENFPSIAEKPGLPAVIPVLSAASVDVQPEFPGGLDKFYEHLMDNIHFTDLARSLGISGKLYVSFIISDNGTLDSVKVKNKIGSGIDEQVISALKISPKWKPGMVKGEAVNTMMILPVNFSLK